MQLIASNGAARPGARMAKAFLALLVAGCAVVAPFALHLYADRQHNVVIRGPVTVYRSATPQWLDSSNSVLASVSGQNMLHVRRIRYEKEYIGVRVQLEDGRQGYIFAGDNFQLVPARW